MTERLPDGVKGVVYTPHVEPPPAIPGGDPYLAPISWHGCHALVFGEVELVGKTAFAGRDGLGIFTKLRFKVVDDWRPGEHRAPATVHLTLRGGELNYNGEAFRFENTLGHYRLHARYVLLAGERTEREGDAMMGQPPYLDIADGLIYPGPGWAPFARGTSLVQAKADVARAMSSAPCAR